jgi:hypothetical protein
MCSTYCLDDIANRADDELGLIEWYPVPALRGHDVPPVR